ncbi:MAG TPA: hypothetical protein H9881_03440 [Candidatus Stackebrandtia excrementipullorum]|nr:hypothetical protein [Candidatus Stackebrandtia excrementipullorum]
MSELNDRIASSETETFEVADVVTNEDLAAAPSSSTGTTSCSPACFTSSCA